MSVAVFGGDFELLAAPSVNVHTFGGDFALLEPPAEGPSVTRTFGGGFALLAAVLGSKTFGGDFALLPPAVSGSIRIMRIGDELVPVPELVKIGGQLVDPVTGEVWTP